MNKIEEKFIKNFVSKGKKERYLALLNKNRNKFLLELSHSIDLKFNKFKNLKSNKKEFILSKTKTFKSCYLVSENSNLDGKILDIEEALDSVLGYGMGTIMIFGDSEKIFYEGEGKNNRWLSV